jgi:hypothetical protein
LKMYHPATLAIPFNSSTEMKLSQSVLSDDRLGSKKVFAFLLVHRAEIGPRVSLILTEKIRIRVIRKSQSQVFAFYGFSIYEWALCLPAYVGCQNVTPSILKISIFLRPVFTTWLRPYGWCSTLEMMFGPYGWCFAPRGEVWPVDVNFDPLGWTLIRRCELWPLGVNFDP